MCIRDSLCRLRMTVTPFPVRTALPSRSTMGRSDSPRAVGCFSLCRGSACLPGSGVSRGLRFPLKSGSWFPISCLTIGIPYLSRRFRTGTQGVSRVQDASLVTCRSLRTPPALPRLTIAPSSFRFHARYNADQSGTAFRSDTSSKGLRPQPAYDIPCVRFTSLVRLCRSLHRFTAPPEAQHSVMVGG